MPIIVTITKSPEFSSTSELSKAFDEQGGSLGRGAIVKLVVRMASFL